MQYIAIIHNNTASKVDASEWSEFIQRAIASGLFKGGSAIRYQSTIGSADHHPTADFLGGFMRFDADHAEIIVNLLQCHPVVIHGGSIELYEMPVTG